MNLTEKENLFEALVFSLGDEYDKLMLHEFVNYWSEPNRSGTKMRWELEKTWDIKRRLKTWFNNNQKWNKQNKNGTYHNSKTAGAHQLLEELRANYGSKQG